jgi:protease IV
MSTFLRQVFATMVGVFLLGLLLLIIVLGSLPDEEGVVLTDGSILIVDLSLPVMDNPVPAGFDALFGASSPVDPTPLHQLCAGIRLAADDPRIAGLYLSGSVGSTGWANLHALRQAIEVFAVTEKPILSYFPYYDERALYLASLADSVYIPPFSEVDLSGPAAEINYYADAFERFGVEVQVTRVGKYKSAVEPYLLGQMSAENREQLQTLLNDIFDPALEAIADGYALEVDVLRKIVAERGVLTSSEALEAELVDGVRYAEEVARELREITEEGDWEGAGRYDFDQIWLEEYVASEVEEDSRVDGATVAVLFAEGDIVDGPSSDQIGGETLALALEEARLDDGIVAVVLRVDSPGGSASASEVILHQVELLSQSKPVVISMGDLAASGGYWISSLADEIYAEANTITGSIGVFGMYPNVAGLAKELGVAVETVELGPHANLYSMYQSKSAATLARLQVSVDDVYDGFLQRVANGRELEVDAVHEIAQGRVWSGQRALELGLIDNVGGLDDALQRAAHLAGLTEGFAVEYWTYEADAWEEFIASLVEQSPGSLVQATKAAQPLTSALPKALADVMVELNRLGARNGVYARMPFDFRLR